MICLNKLGETLNLQVTQSSISTSQLGTAAAANGNGNGLASEIVFRLSAINSTSSAFCAFVFSQDFFQSIRLTGKGAFSGSVGKLECQVNIRSLLASFKTNSSGGHKLDRCELSITDSGTACRLSVRLHYQYGVTKTHKLTYEAQQAVFPSANPDPGSAIAVSAQTVQEWLMHFSATGRGADISLWCGADFCTVRSKSDDFETGKIRKSIQTEVKVETDQFQLYQVNAEAFLTLPIREFRAAVTVAESLLAPLELHFSVGGEPLFVRIFAEAVHVEMVIATTDAKPPEMDGNFQDTASRAARQGSAANHRQPSISNSGTRQPTESVPPQSRSQSTAPASMPRDHQSVGMSESQMPLVEPQPIIRPSQQPQHSTPAGPARSKPQNGAVTQQDHLPRQASPLRSDDGDEDGQEVTRISSSQLAPSQRLFRGEVASQEDPQPITERTTTSMPPPIVHTRRIGRPSAAADRTDTANLPAVRAMSDGADISRTLADEDGDVSFDYDGAFDEMERDIQEGRLQVHGSQQQTQTQPHTTQRPAVPVAADEQDRGSRSRSIVLEPEGDLLAASPPPGDDDEGETLPSTQSVTVDDDSVDSSGRGSGGGVESRRYRPMFG